MKIYVAGRFKKKELIKEYYSVLEEKGHTITNKWTEQESIKPFLQNKEKAIQYIKEDFDGIKNADIFILIAEYEVDARGCNIELGYALNEASKRDLKIYVVNGDDNPSMFFLSPEINLVKEFGDVLKLLN